MRVAICYSGFLRNIEKTFPNIIDKILNYSQVDFFVHTWDVDEYNKENNFAKNTIKPKLMVIDRQKSFERNPYNFINSYTTPEEYKNKLDASGEDKKFFPIPSEENNFKFHKDLEVVKFGHYSSYPYNFLSQFYSIHKSIELKAIYEQQNNFTYDCVIRIRPDVYLYDTIDLKNLSMDLMNVFYAPKHRGTDLTINDHFACSSSESMGIYGECFLYLPTYYFTYKVDFIQEIILGKHLEVNQMKLNTLMTQYLITRDSIHKERYPKFVR